MVTRDIPWPAGTPCWADLMTTDAAAARQFYTELFGWEISIGGEDTGNYGMASVGGRMVAGLGETMTEGQPPVWTTYLATSDADATAAAITKAGGTLLQEPFDVMEFGRMLIATDPTGAVFGVWQAGQHSGFQIANDMNTVTWNEVLTRDYAAAKNFYADAFGWTFTPLGDEYATFEVDSNTAGGIGALPAAAPATAPAHWRTYVAVGDTDAAVAKAVELGGTVARPAEDMPYGRHADLQDPHGALFCVIKPGTPE